MYSLSPHQLAQCTGEDYDEINKLLQDTEEKEAALDDTDDNDDDDDATSKQRRLFELYRSYLERTRKQRKISDRGKNVTAELVSKLQGRSPKDMP